MVTFIEDLDRSIETLGPLRSGHPSRLTAPVIGEARRRGRYLRGRAFRLAMAALLKSFGALARQIMGGPVSLRSWFRARWPGGPFGLTPPLTPP